MAEAMEVRTSLTQIIHLHPAPPPPRRLLQQQRQKQVVVLVVWYCYSCYRRLARLNYSSSSSSSLRGPRLLQSSMCRVAAAAFAQQHVPEPEQARDRQSESEEPQRMT